MNHFLTVITYGTLIYMGVGIIAAGSLLVSWAVNRYRAKVLVHEVEQFLRTFRVEKARP